MCPDGRGDTRLGSPEGIQAAIAGAAVDAPPHHFLLGVIPLKLMRVDYVVENRNDKFVASIRDELIEVCEIGRGIRNAPDPTGAFQKYVGDHRKLTGTEKIVDHWGDCEEFANVPVRVG
jgi:hypothetical protein